MKVQPNAGLDEGWTFRDAAVLLESVSNQLAKSTYEAGSIFDEDGESIGTWEITEKES